MTTPSDKPKQDGSFSSFTVGVALGVMGALLFGTEEGRSIVKKVISAVPEKYKRPIPTSLRNLVNPPTPSLRGTPWQSSLSTTPVIPTEETQHHTTFAYSSPFGEAIAGEAPPPPAPHVRPTLSEPFHPNS